MIFPAEEFDLLDPLNFIIDREILDGSDVLSNSSTADDNETIPDKGRLW